VSFGSGGHYMLLVELFCLLLVLRPSWSGSFPNPIEGSANAVFQLAIHRIFFGAPSSLINISELICSRLWHD
jgi:hypothetical protein